MLTSIPIVEHSWNKRLSYLRGAQHSCTVFFLNALKVSLAPTPQEGSFHVIFVRIQRSQEPEEPKVCHWNHLSLSVTVPAKLTSRHGRGLELTQPHFAAQTKTFEHERQNATKSNRLLSQTCIQTISILAKTLCLFLVLMTISPSVFPFLFSPSCVAMPSSKPIDVGRVNRWTKPADQRREDHFYQALAFSRHTSTWCLMRRV